MLFLPCPLVFKTPPSGNLSRHPTTTFGSHGFEASLHSSVSCFAFRLMKPGLAKWLCKRGGARTCDTTKEQKMFPTCLINSVFFVANDHPSHRLPSIIHKHLCVAHRDASNSLEAKWQGSIAPHQLNQSRALLGKAIPKFRAKHPADLVTVAAPPPVPFPPVLFFIMSGDGVA